MRDITKAAADNRTGIMTVNRTILAVVYCQGQFEESSKELASSASRRWCKYIGAAGAQVQKLCRIVRPRGLKEDPEATTELGGLDWAFDRFVQRIRLYITQFKV